jgi:sulfur-oxidizing protein SoxY
MVVMSPRRLPLPPSFKHWGERAEVRGSLRTVRRRILLALPALLLLPRETPASPGLDAVLRAHLGDVVPTPGRVKLDISPLVENGNTVPVTITADSPMTEADHVVSLALFNERNPQNDVFVATLGPRAGRAMVSTRIRLATSQKLVAVARMSDGTAWSDTALVVVTLAACVEG